MIFSSSIFGHECVKAMIRPWIFLHSSKIGGLYISKYGIYWLQLMCCGLHWWCHTLMCQPLHYWTQRRIYIEATWHMTFGGGPSKAYTLLPKKERWLDPFGTLSPFKSWKRLGTNMIIVHGGIGKVFKLYLIYFFSHIIFIS